jgi:hypothetical protein
MNFFQNLSFSNLFKFLENTLSNENNEDCNALKMFMGILYSLYIDFKLIHMFP